jgi:hypothetical protein
MVAAAFNIELIKKILCIYGTQRFISMLKKYLPVLSQFIPFTS